MGPGESATNGERRRSRRRGETLSNAGQRPRRSLCRNRCPYIRYCLLRPCDGRRFGRCRRRDDVAAALSLSRPGGCRPEHQRDAVDAVPLAGGRRAIVEDVAEMSAAAAAMLLGARHEEGGVLL